MPKLLPYATSSTDDTTGGYMFWCPGCKEHHGFRTRSPDGKGPVWTFDGNLEAPTFSPSLLCFRTDRDTGKRKTLCHLFLKAGKLQFLNDCPHELAGQTVDLPEEDDDGR